MADINIERRSRSRWRWILGALLLFLLFWFAAELIRSRAAGMSLPGAGPDLVAILCASGDRKEAV